MSVVQMQARVPWAPVVVVGDAAYLVLVGSLRAQTVRRDRRSRVCPDPSGNNLPRGVYPGIVARMLCIASVRVAEPWTFWNILGALFLVAVVVGIVYWAIQRR